MIDDEAISQHINEFIFECTIQEFESEILRVMKDRQKLYPSEKNDLEWKAFSEFIHKRNSGSLGELSWKVQVDL